MSTLLTRTLETRARWRARRNRRTDALWSLIATGLVLLILPWLLFLPTADPLLAPALCVVGVLFLLFGGYILALEHQLADRRERDRLDAAALRAASLKESR